MLVASSSRLPVVIPSFQVANCYLNKACDENTSIFYTFSDLLDQQYGFQSTGTMRETYTVTLLPG